MPQTSGRTIMHGFSKDINDPMREPESCLSGKNESKSKVLKQTKSGARRVKTGNVFSFRQFNVICVTIC